MKSKEDKSPLKSPISLSLGNFNTFILLCKTPPFNLSNNFCVDSQASPSKHIITLPFALLYISDHKCSETVFPSNGIALDKKPYQKHPQLNKCLFPN